MNLNTLGTTERLTIADLAHRLGVSPAAARIQAKRAARTGECRIIRGGRPSDPVLVEVVRPRPAAAAAGGVQEVEPAQGEPAGTGGNSPSQPAPLSAAEMAGLAGRVLTYLSEVQARNRELVDQLTEAKEAHRRDTMELIGAEMREMATKEDLERALDQIARMRRELAKLKQPWWRRWGK